MKVLVTGTTGYVGGRLVPRLLEEGHEVRVLVRDPRRIEGRAWAGAVETMAGDLADPDSLRRGLEGMEGAYYLVHSMYDTRDFAERDRRLARNFARAAAAAGVRSVVYLGGLLPRADDVSEHLRSRAEVGEILREGAGATELRAGPIIGSGSASFEMVRYLTERLPAMIAPRWIMNMVQPVAVRDVLRYLLLALERAPGGVVEIGADQLPFVEMMRVYAAVRGLRRAIIPVPVLAPRLASLWVGLVTPIPNRLATPLVMGVVHPVVANTGRARELFPEVRPISYRRAVELALERVDDAGGAHPLERRAGERAVVPAAGLGRNAARGALGARGRAGGCGVRHLQRAGRGARVAGVELGVAAARGDGSRGGRPRPAPRPPRPR